MTVADAIVWATSFLERSDELAPRARADATLLLRYALGASHAEICAHPERLLQPSEIQDFRTNIDARLYGWPIQYIVREQEFFGLNFEVTPDVLIPRPETEHLVEAAIERLQDVGSPRIADVGTGSGAIAVALAKALPQARIVALDISPAALAVAARNARQNEVFGRIRFAQSDLLSSVAGEIFDAIVSNPPYIAIGERDLLPKEVQFEPATALLAGTEGTEFHRRLAESAAPLLATGGWLLMEIGHGQQPAIETMLTGWGVVEWIPDLQGIPRVAIARKPRTSPGQAEPVKLI